MIQFYKSPFENKSNCRQLLEKSPAKQQVIICFLWMVGWTLFWWSTAWPVLEANLFLYGSVGTAALEPSLCRKLACFGRWKDALECCHPRSGTSANGERPSREDMHALCPLPNYVNQMTAWHRWWLLLRMSLREHPTYTWSKQCCPFICRETNQSPVVSLFLYLWDWTESLKYHYSVSILKDKIYSQIWSIAPEPLEPGEKPQKKQTNRKAIKEKSYKRNPPTGALVRRRMMTEFHWEFYSLWSFSKMKMLYFFFLRLISTIFKRWYPFLFIFSTPPAS